MKQILITTMYKTLLLLFFLLPLPMKAHPFEPQEPVLILNMENTETHPRLFRMMPGIFENPPFSTEGLEQFNASASGQFSKISFAHFRKILPKNILVVDLRQEAHGFADGTAVSWYSEGDWMNVGKSLDLILEDEKQRLKDLMLKGSYHLQIADSSSLRRIKEVQSEEEVILSQGASYLRLPITDHCRPNDETVQEIVNLLQNREYDWFHFHCSAGKGRSSTLMVMYDMILNAKKVSLKDIFQRQHSIGGVNFMSEPNPELWKYPHLKERILFLVAFYHFCQESDANFTEKWSHWAKNHPQYFTLNLSKS